METGDFADILADASAEARRAGVEPANPGMWVDARTRGVRPH
jgi:hypothetical protein